MSWYQTRYAKNNCVDSIDNEIFYEDFRILNEVEVVVNCYRDKNTARTLLNLACGPNPQHAILLDEHFSFEHIHSIDINAEYIEKAKNDFSYRSERYYGMCLNSTAKFLTLDLLNIEINSFANKRYDIITLFGNSFGYFSHEENIKLLWNIFNLLNPGGALFITVPDYDIALSHDIHNPITWEIVSSLNGKSHRSSRYYDVTSQISLCKTDYYKEGIYQESRVRNIYIYPYFRSENKLFSYEKSKDIIGFKKSSIHKLPFNDSSFGLMKNLNMVVLVK